MTLLQVVAGAVETPEPIVMGALVAGAGIVLLWFANRFMAMMKLMQSVTTALFGDKESPVRNGVVRKLDAIDRRLISHMSAFEMHVSDDAVWKQEVYVAIHRWNEHATVMLAAVVPPVALPPLVLPFPPDRRKKPR